MSLAHECDLCGALYKPGKGTCSVDLNLDSDREDGACDGWDGIDLCRDCTAPLLARLKPALIGYDEDGK